MNRSRTGFTHVGAESRAAPANDECRMTNDECQNSHSSFVIRKFDIVSRPPRLRGPTCRDGFTLFEVILAIALSATLLTLIGTANSGRGQSSASSSTSGESPTDNTMPLGVTGSQEELYVDVTHLPKQDELFASTTGYTNAPSPTVTGSAGTSTTSGGSNSPS